MSDSWQIAALENLGRELHSAAEGSEVTVRRRPLVWIVAAALLVLVLGLALTPPGRTLASKMGDLVGIGDPATLPPQHLGTMSERGQPLVIASGHAPDGTAYEIVADRSVYEHPDTFPERAGQADGPMTCLTLDLPESPKANGVEICFGPEDRQFLSGNVLDAVNYLDRAVPPAGETGEQPPQSRYVITAELSPNIADVRATYEGTDGARVDAYTDLGQVDDEIGSKLGTDERVGYMVAFVPDDGEPPAFTRGDDDPREPGFLGTVELTGYDADGRAIVHDNFGARIIQDFERASRDAAEKKAFEEQIEAAEEKGLQLDRATVELCTDALRHGIRTDACSRLIHEAAKQDLFGLHTG